MYSDNKILLTGATGYVGDTVLDHLIKCTEPSIQSLSFDLLIRGGSQAEKLCETYGARVNPIMWKGLDDVEFITNTAANYDIVINAGSGFNPDAARAFVDGLSRRIGTEKPTPWMIHISGCTNAADRPITGGAYVGREGDDADGEAIYNFIKSEDEKSPYHQRTTEVGVLAAGEESGVQAVSLNTPASLAKGRHGYGFKLNDTCNFDWVHIEDLADVYVLLIRTILEREDRGVGYIPSGKKGVILPAVERVMHSEIMQKRLDAAFEAGVLPRADTPKEKEIRQVGLREIADEAMAGGARLSGTQRPKGTTAKELLGWKPSRLQEAWGQDFADSLKLLKEG